MATQSQERLAYEEIPYNKFHTRIAICGPGGEFSDGFVLGIIGIVIITAGRYDALELTPFTTGLLGAATLIGLFIGAIVTGPIADRIGRRPIFRWDMLIFALLSIAQFFVADTYQLVVLRLILGLVLGADYVVGKSLVAEHAPRRMRGRLLSIMAVAWAAGYVFAYLIGFLLTNAGPDSWRYMLASAAIPTLIVFAFRFGVPESPMWLA